MDAGGRTKSKRSIRKLSRHPLLVERVSGLVQGGEERLRHVELIDAGRDAHIARGELGAKRMVRFIKAAAPGVVAERACHGQAKLELRTFGKTARAQAR